jgi:hypothetical protein
VGRKPPTPQSNYSRPIPRHPFIHATFGATKSGGGRAARVGLALPAHEFMMMGESMKETGMRFISRWLTVLLVSGVIPVLMMGCNETSR